MTDWRKAVELADGFENRQWHDNGLNFIIRDPYHPVSIIVDADEFAIPQWAKDAIAAQLVRQVDEVCDWNDLFTQYMAECLNQSDDRTENTVNAILDSGVLE